MSKFIEYTNEFHEFTIDALNMLAPPYAKLSIRTPKYVQESTFSICTPHNDTRRSLEIP